MGTIADWAAAMGNVLWGCQMWYNACGPHTSTTVKATILPSGRACHIGPRPAHSQSHYSQNPTPNSILPSTIPSHSNSWFWTRRSRSLIRLFIPICHFSFQYPYFTNGLFHNPISTNPPITSSNINRSIPNTSSINTSITSTPTTISSTPTIAEIRHQRSKYALERTFQVWGKSKLACSYVQANHASSAKFLRSPVLSTGQAIGASLLSLARCGGLWDYPRALKAGLLHPTATDLYQLGSPSLCILCHSHLDCKPMAHLVHSPRPTSQSAPSSPSSPSGFSISSFSHFSPDTRFEPPISVAQQEIPQQAQDTVEENPTASRTTTTDTHTAAISSTPTPTHISYIGSDDILTVLLGGSLPGTNTAGNTEACPGQQWLTADHCILCKQQLLSTSIAHLVVKCEQVTGHRIQSGLVPAIQKSRLRLLGRALDPGMENVYTWLRGGVLNGQSKSGSVCWLDGTVEHESMGTRHDNRALAARLADFLQVAYRQYQSTLWKYRRDRLVEVG
ncbi:hypothetical protein BASA60_007118 [Batrachochytrium salamandrivorans]|nr:hypothetical protein BASA60_007118 [Batrachochytrium salamandrivorans]